VSSIIRNCPFFDRTTTVTVNGDQITILPYQIILWVAVRSGGVTSRTFPAIVDTGNSFSFSIREEQLESWAGIHADSLPRAGTIEINNRKQIVRVADLALLRNIPNQRDMFRGFFELALPRGIAVYARNEPTAPRLPLLGLRALVHNRLAVKIDGRRMRVKISRPWF
jgi:hypothetical protein